MVQTATDVCNLAIGRIGGDPIDALDEDSPLAAYCSQNYGQKRNWLLGGYRWVFASENVQLNRQLDAGANAPLPNLFTPPGDLVGTVHAFRNGPRETDANVRVVANAGGYYSASAVVWAEYTAQRAEANWPVWFVELVRVAFASDLAMHVQNRSLSAQLHEIAFGGPDMQGKGGLYGQAMTEDARAAPQRQLFYDSAGPLIEARYGGVGLDGYVRIGGFRG